jgi:starvation-inducible DNA-binding protein
LRVARYSSAIGGIPDPRREQKRDSGVSDADRPDTHLFPNVLPGDPPMRAEKTKPRLATPTDLKSNATKEITGALNALLADTFALYMKTKNFHWHVSGPNFRDFHLMFDEQAGQIFATTDIIAERVRKIGGTTLHSIGDIARHQRLSDNDADFVDAQDMLAELREDNQRCIAAMREVHSLCDEHEDVATASQLENFIDEAERRFWFLYEAGRHATATGQ